MTSTTDTVAPATDRCEENLDRYLRFWNTAPDDEGAIQAADVFGEEVRYTAPVGVLAGRQALIGFRRQFVQHMGSVAFRARREPEIHHGHARLLWRLDVRGEQFATGTDVLAFDPDGRIGTVTTFLDEAPEGFDPHAHA
ncbi:isomerase [Streptomyces sp. SID8111]|uniref:isomerase n=1 Tax=Streptomyces sp. SID8111 TaxID=2706100 RepID=UPI0013BF5DC4|nr:isomerase [Streptomyces sp. SID8111]NEC25715.1 isomerase [Streptomyces sp. SID8111]